MTVSRFETATLGAGCFWCIEAVFRALPGVLDVVSGYSGGHVKNPDYEQVCSGRTGHAEVVQVKFDPEAISYGSILEVFFHVHDPTTLNRQGNDVGTQYRSVVFFHSEPQREIAGRMKKEIPGCVTELAPFGKFYPAEEYHQHYFENNASRPYCRFVIEPKMQKFRQRFLRES